MGTKTAARPGRRRIYWGVAACILVYMGAITKVTVVLWHRKLIHDAVSVGSYATAVLAVSTIVLFGATALLAAATVDLVRAEREEARREEEKYELERDARNEEENLRAQQAKVYKNGREVVLTALEYRLLLTLILNQGRVLTRGQILAQIWDVDEDFVNDNTLTVYIKRLREKLEDDPQNPALIKTVRGLGYRIGNDETPT